MFGDLTHIVPEGTFDPHDDFQTRLRAINKARLLTRQHCYTHGISCQIYGGARPDYDLSGLPCPDHSPAGLKQYEQGPTSSVFACHAKLHIALQTPMLIIENVPDKGLKNVIQFSLIRSSKNQKKRFGPFWEVFEMKFSE